MGTQQKFRCSEAAAKRECPWGWISCAAEANARPAQHRTLAGKNSCPRLGRQN